MAIDQKLLENIAAQQGGDMDAARRIAASLGGTGADTSNRDAITWQLMQQQMQPGGGGGGMPWGGVDWMKGYNPMMGGQLGGPFQADNTGAPVPPGSNPGFFGMNTDFTFGPISQAPTAPNTRGDLSPAPGWSPSTPPMTQDEKDNLAGERGTPVGPTTPPGFNNYDPPQQAPPNFDFPGFNPTVPFDPPESVPGTPLSDAAKAELNAAAAAVAAQNAAKGGGWGSFFSGLNPFSNTHNEYDPGVAVTTDPADYGGGGYPIDSPYGGYGGGWGDPGGDYGNVGPS